MRNFWLGSILINIFMIIVLCYPSLLFFELKHSWIILFDVLYSIFIIFCIVSTIIILISIIEDDNYDQLEKIFPLYKQSWWYHCFIWLISFVFLFQYEFYLYIFIISVLIIFYSWLLIVYNNYINKKIPEEAQKAHKIKNEILK